MNQDSQSNQKPDAIVGQAGSSGFFDFVKNTEAYQLFFVRAVQDKFCRQYGYLLLACLTMFIVSLRFVYFMPPLRLDEMRVTQGYLIEVYKIPGDRVMFIRNEKGEVKKYILGIPDEDLPKYERIKGEFITVYHDSGVPGYRYDSIREVRYKNTYLKNYTSDDYARSIFMHDLFTKLMIVSVVVFFMTVFIVYLRHRKD